MRTARKTEAKSFRLWLVQSVGNCKRENRSAATLWMGFGAAFLHVAISIFQHTLVLQVVNWYCWCCAYLWMGPQLHWLCASEETDDSQKRCEITLRNQTDITACQADSSCICAFVHLSAWTRNKPLGSEKLDELLELAGPPSWDWEEWKWMCPSANEFDFTLKTMQLDYTVIHPVTKQTSFHQLKDFLHWSMSWFEAEECLELAFQSLELQGVQMTSCSLKVFLCLLGCMLSSAFGNGRVNRKKALNFIVLVVLQVFLQRTSPIRTPHRGAKVLFHLSVLGPEIVTCNWPLNHWIQAGNDTSKASGAVKSTTVPDVEDEDSGMASYVVRMSQCAYYICILFW